MSGFWFMWKSGHESGQMRTENPDIYVRICPHFGGLVHIFVHIRQNPDIIVLYNQMIDVFKQ